MPALLAFQAVVRGEGGWPTFIRTPRGREEAAACGQLATEVAAGARKVGRLKRGDGGSSSGE
jgi:adenine C2-methylase RlmN of 23S rRNA A2503 and tRNA A37